MKTNYNFKEDEQEIQEFWNKNQIFQKTRDKNKGRQKFYFLDGPPYTSGKIHLGQAWNKSLKDSILRFKRMKGFDTWDRAGYDMHGLPTEHKAEAELGIKNKDEIKEYGVGEFVKACRDISIRNMEAMNNDFRKLGVWMDFDNPYMSANNSYIEGEWWLCKKAHENNRLYQGERTMHWCPNCATSLAKHELEYNNVTDKSIFIKFKVVGTENEYLIIWTTTPWTIPFNLGVMANPELEYVKVNVEGEVWIMAAQLAPAFITTLLDKDFEVVEKFTGDKLEGLKYEHPFEKHIPKYEELKQSEKVFSVVLSTEYVDFSGGSGLVHMAPGCGPEDYEVGARNGIPPFNNLTELGVFPEEMGKFAGLTAKKDDEKFIEALEEDGALVNTSHVQHDYPHCWRCHKPVIFRTTEQWFFKVEDLKENLRELNKDINWVPDWAGSRQFDSWLDNLRDNCITRQRYWGTPVPIWKCDKCNHHVVIGSVEELKQYTDNVPEDLHKPWIDEVKFKCEECGEQMERIPDIFDVWIDAGSASWLCLDYPRNPELFDKWYPADFILEGKDQIRGWFNMLMVAGIVAMNRPSYKAVYMHGFINDAYGRKFSKSLGNAISPLEVIEKYGADLLRYYMIGGTNAGLDLNYNFEDMETRFRNLRILWNLHKFAIDNMKNHPEAKLEDVRDNLSDEDKYILSYLNSTLKKVTALFDEYRLDEVPEEIEKLYLEVSRTYVQLVRDRLNSEGKTVSCVLYHLIFEINKMLSPIVPHMTEAMYQNFKEAFGLEAESVHLLDWSGVEQDMIDTKLEENVNDMKDVTAAILSIREVAGFGVRWPLKEAIVSGESSDFLRLKELIKRMANVKDVRVGHIPEEDKFVSTEFSLGKVAVDTELSYELKQEGYFRELVRRVQNARKKAGLVKSDWIKLQLSLPEEMKNMLSEMTDDMKDKVGAREVTIVDETSFEFSKEEKIKGEKLTVALEKSQ